MEITKWYGVKKGSTKSDFAALHRAASDRFTFGQCGFPVSIVVKYDYKMKEPSAWRLGITYRNEDAEIAYSTCEEFERDLSELESVKGKWASYPCELADKQNPA